MTAPGQPPKRSRTSSSRPSRHHPKIEVAINVYDLLPPGRLSSVLWTLGSALLHSGVVLQDREYAYGGHSHRRVTGVYYTAPQHLPPGGTFRCSILQGFTFRSADEVERIVKDVSAEFLGTEYNLLTRNCNHFTSVLCERLTGKPAPTWLNRAASIGLAVPCMVPREWVSPPDVETAEGELVDQEEEEDEDGEDDGGDERVGMLDRERRQRLREEESWSQRSKRHDGSLGTQSTLLDDLEDHDHDGSSLAGGRRSHGGRSTPPPRSVSLKDSDGRTMPVAERAPVPASSRG
nr:desi-like protein sdu1 [Quercus suber]